MPASDYYTDTVDELPFSAVVDLYAQSVPRLLANVLVGWSRLRSTLGVPVMPLYGSLWNPDLEWQQRREMPAQGLSRLAPWIEKVEDLGFEINGWVKNETVGNKSEVNCFLVNEADHTVAQLLWLQIESIEHSKLTFTSYLGDGTEIVTAALPIQQQALAALLAPEYIKFATRPQDTSPRELYRVHTERSEGSAAIPLTHETLLPLYRRQRKRLFEFGVESKVLRPLSEREFRHLQQRTTN